MKTPGADTPYGTYYWSGPGRRVTENIDGDDSRVIMDRAIPFIRNAEDVLPDHDYLEKVEEGAVPSENAAENTEESEIAVEATAD